MLAGWTAVGGAPGVAGTSADTYYSLSSPSLTSPTEWAVVSSDGWWINVRDDRAHLTPFILNEAVRQFLASNPGRR